MSNLRTRTKHILNERPAIAGETFRFRSLFNGQVFKIHPKAEGKKGQWVCCTCGMPLSNNTEKDSHAHEPKQRQNCMTVVLDEQSVRHVFAWRNFTTGNHEVP